MATGMLAGLLALILILGLKPARMQSQLADTIQTGGHFICFGILAVLTAMLLPSLIPEWQRRTAWCYATGFLFAVFVGGALEGLQGLTATRSPSWHDLVHDTLGSLAGIALLATVDRPSPTRGMPRWLLWMALPVLLTALTLGLLPLGVCLRDYYSRNQAFPHLHVFAQRWSERFSWHDPCVNVAATTPPSGWPSTAGADVGEVWLEPEENSPGIGFKEPVPNWVGYKTFAFDCLNPGNDAIPMAVRVHDFAHNDDMYDRYNRVLQIAPGFQTIRLSLSEIQTGPRQRQLDMTSIEGIKLFAIKPTQRLHLYLGNFLLEKH